MLIAKIFHETELTKILARVHTEHAAASRVLEKLGFICEGRLRKQVIVQGRKVDQFLYGLLKEDWLERTS